MQITQRKKKYITLFRLSGYARPCRVGGGSPPNSAGVSARCPGKVAAPPVCGGNKCGWAGRRGGRLLVRAAPCPSAGCPPACLPGRGRVGRLFCPSVWSAGCSCRCGGAAGGGRARPICPCGGSAVKCLPDVRASAESVARSPPVRVKWSPPSAGRVCP